jgi:2-methylcitrate dehydratase
MDQLTRTIAEFATGFGLREAPEAIVAGAERSLADTVACALGGRDCEVARIGRRLAEGQATECYAGRILGEDERTGPELAAFANTAMLRYLDFNDTWHGGHPSDLTGGLLAIAESVGANGERFLAAMIVGYEVALRLIRATGLRERGWDQGFAIGVGTAAALANLLRLPLERAADAIAITAVANVPLRATRAGKLSLWKGAATAFACRNGLFAALLAAQGVTGPDRPFEGRHGLWEQITGPFELEPFPTAGGRFLVPTVRLKYWPVEYNAQAAVWAALELRARLKPEAIATIDIATYWSAWHEIGSEPEKWDPTTRETADHSMPFIFARTLTDGTITVHSFDDYADPSLRPLMAKISVRQDPEIDKRFPEVVVMRVTATGTDGSTHEIEVVNPKGHDRNPMTDADVGVKFRTLAEPVLGVAGAATAWSRWQSIRQAPSLTPAMDALVVRFRSSPTLAARSKANFGIKGPLATL